MNPIRCLLVDDEELALDVLEIYLDRLEGFEVAGRCTNALEASSFLNENPVDLVFLDIQMPKLNGMEWIKSLPTPPKVIFCTAFSNFALESYEVNAIDYLLKPVSFERFEKAVGKAADIIHKEQRLADLKEEEFISIKSERRFYKIPINSILYIHSLSNYYQVVTPEKKIIVYGSLSALENKLSANQFIRIHRSYLVAINKIEAISSTVILLEGKKIPVGRKYRDSVEALIDRKNPA
nr:LytTR family DNA-binding domain-containing protein [uncultured Bacteroides sp.]